MFLTRNNVEGALAGKNITVNDLTVTGKLNATVQVEKIDVKKATLENLTVTEVLDATQAAVGHLTVDNALEVDKGDFKRITVDYQSNYDPAAGLKYNYLMTTDNTNNQVKIGTAPVGSLSERNVNLNVHGNVNIEGAQDITGNQLVTGNQIVNGAQTVAGNTRINGYLTVHDKEIIQLIHEEAGGGGGGGGGDIENINCETLKVGEVKTVPDEPTYIMTADNDQVTLGYTDADDPENNRKVDLTVNGDLFVTKIGSVLEGTKEQQQDITIGEGEVVDKAHPENNYYPNNVNMYGDSIWIQANEHNIIVSDFINVGETTSNSDEVDITEEEETKTITLQKTEAVTENIRLDTQKMRINCLPQNILLVEPDNETTEVMDFKGEDVPFERLDPDNKTDYFHKEKSTTLPEYISDQVEKKVDYLSDLIENRVKLLREFGSNNPTDEEGIIIGHLQQSEVAKTLKKVGGDPKQNPDKHVIGINYEEKSDVIALESKSLRVFAKPENFYFTTNAATGENEVYDRKTKKLIGYDEAIDGETYDNTYVFATSLPDYIDGRINGYNFFGTNITTSILVGNHIEKTEVTKTKKKKEGTETKKVTVYDYGPQTKFLKLRGKKTTLEVEDGNLMIRDVTRASENTVYDENGTLVQFDKIDTKKKYYDYKVTEQNLKSYINRALRYGNEQDAGDVYLGFHDNSVEPPLTNGKTIIGGSQIVMNHKGLNLGKISQNCQVIAYVLSRGQHPPTPHICNYEPSSNEEEEEGEWVEISLMDYLDPRTCTKMGTNLSPDQDIVIGTERVTTITNEEGNEETIYDAMGNVDIHGKTVNIDGNIVDIGDAQNGKTYIKGKLIDLGDHTSIFLKKDGTTMTLAEYASQAAGGGGTVSCDTASNFGTTTESTYVSVGNTSSGLRLTGKEIIVQNKGLSPMDLNTYIQSVVGEEIETASASKFGTTTTENIVTVGNADSILSLNGTVLQVKEGSGETRTLDTYISDVTKSIDITSGSVNFGTTSGAAVTVGNTNSTLSLMGKQIMIAKAGETAKEMISYIDEAIDSKVVPVEEQNNFGTRLADGQHIIIGTALNETTVDEETGEENTVSTAAGNIILNGKQIVLGSDEYAPMVTYNQVIIDDVGKQTIVFGAMDSLHDYLDHQVAFHTRYNNMFGDQTNMAKVQLGGTDVPATNIVGKTIYIGENGNSLVSLEKYIKQKASNMTNVTVSDADNANETTITPGWVVTDNATVTEELAVGNITVTGQVSTENITTETNDGVINVNRPLLIQNEGEGDSYSTTINGGNINAYELRLTHELNGTDATFTGGVTANTITCNELNTDEDELPVKKKMRFSDPLQNAVMDRTSQYTTHKVMINLNKDDTSDKGDKTFNIVFTRLNELYIAVTAPTKLELAGKEWLERFNAGTATISSFSAETMGNIFPDGFNTSDMASFSIPFIIRATYTDGVYFYNGGLWLNPQSNKMEINFTGDVFEKLTENNQLLALDCIPGTATVLCPIAEAQYDFI